MNFWETITGSDLTREWKAFEARAEALPADHRAAIGPIDLADGLLLSGIVDFFEEGAAAGQGVLELIGNDVAAFCDYLVNGSRTYADIYQESISGEPGPAGK